MKAITRVSVLAIAGLLMSHVTVSAQNWGRPQTPQSGACFYEDINYGGDYFCVSAGATSPQVPYGNNNRISSIRVFGNVEVTVYADSDYRGRSRTFGSDTNDLRRGGWNDRISSYRVGRTASAGRGDSNWRYRWGRAALPSSGACFYEHVNFEGQYFCVPPGDRVEMVPAGTNDAISSMRLLGNVEVTVFRDRDFRGASQRFDGDVRDLQVGGWNDTISSFVVEPRNAGGGFGRGRGRGQGQARGGGLGSIAPDAATGRVEWRGRVDDRVQLIIRGRSLEQRLVSGREYPSGSASFTSGLPPEPVRVTVTKLAGRGNVRVIQQPARGNDFTAIVEISDDGGGSQEYRIEVTWR
jgi:hypothetical protein